MTLEPATWSAAAGLPYSACAAWVDGLEALGIACTVLPATPEFGHGSARNWTYHARRLLDGQHFDQAWLWIGEHPHSEEFLQWLVEVAPVRVGIVLTSVESAVDELERQPRLQARRSEIDQQLIFTTHVISVDEFDAEGFGHRLARPTAWFPPAVPSFALVAGRRAAATKTVALPEAPTSFAPAPIVDVVRRYGDSALAAPPEADPLEPRFNQLQLNASDLLVSGHASAELLESHSRELRGLRRQAFARWLDEIQRYRAAAFVPSALRTCGPRLFETMAASVPVVTWDIPARPRLRALFRSPQCVRRYSELDAGALADHLRELLADTGTAQAQAEAAAAQIRELHVVEVRIEQVLHWIATGEVPSWARVQAPVAADRPCAHWGLPLEYRRRERPATAAPRERAHGDFGVPYALAFAIASKFGCRSVFDLGCPSPDDLVRYATRDVRAVALCDEPTERSHGARDRRVDWVPAAVEELGELPAPQADNPRLVLCAGQFERAANPLALAKSLARLVGRDGLALVFSVDRVARWGPNDIGPPPEPDLRQQWTSGELRTLLAGEGLDCVYSRLLPSEQRPERTSAALLLLPTAAPLHLREHVSRLAPGAVQSCLQARYDAGPYELVEARRRRPPVFVECSSSEPGSSSLQALLPDDTWVAVHSLRVPVLEADRMVRRLAPVDGAAVVVFGLGQGHHVRSLAARPDVGRIVVVEPFSERRAWALDQPSLRALFESSKVTVVSGWKSLKGLPDAGSVVPAAQWLALPAYERLADSELRTMHLLVGAAAEWRRLELGRHVKPFLHPTGVSVVVTTYNRPLGAAAVARAIAAQLPGVPVELLVVNDGGTRDVCSMVREAVNGRCPLRLFDTGYPGYGLTLSRNIGLRHVRYDLTVFLDDDLAPCEDLLEQYLEAPNGLRAGRIDQTYEDAYGLHALPERRMALRGPDRVLAPWEDFQGFMWGGNCAVPTELALAVGGFDERYLGYGRQDLDFSVRVTRATHRIVAVPSARVTHHAERTSPGSLGFEGHPRQGPPGVQPGDSGDIVNGGVTHWGGNRWNDFEVVE